mgnify:CR=1 FL=1
MIHSKKYVGELERLKEKLGEWALMLILVDSIRKLVK